MRLIAVALLTILVLPLPAAASTFMSGRTVVLSDTPTDNVYLTGTDITVVAPLPADLLAAGGTVRVSAPVGGDALLTGGTIDVIRSITGDLRALGGQVTVVGAVDGDLMLAGGLVTASTSAQDVRIIGGTVRLSGSGGHTVIYGADVFLSGTISGNVEVVASNSFTLAEGTHIQGTLSYDAPQEVATAGAQVDGGVTYTGRSSYLPTVEQAKTFAIAGAGVFLLVRILAVLIAAGLLAGLFPVFSQAVADKALARSPGRFIMLALLGFALVVAGPVFILLLLLSFVGMGVAFLLAAVYALLLILGYLYAGVLTGAVLGRGLLKRPNVTWKIAILGMLAFYLIGALPGIGIVITLVLVAAATGAIASIAYSFVFVRGRNDDPTLSF